LFFGISPPPTAPLFIAADRREAVSSTGNSGRKGSGEKFLAGGSGGKTVVPLARRPRPSNWHCREVPTLPIGSCRTGADTGAPAHLLGSPKRRLDFWGASAGRFLAPSPISALATFWEAFWGRRWRCSQLDASSHDPKASRLEDLGKVVGWCHVFRTSCP
jgi:hypothetical protein